MQTIYDRPSGLREKREGVVEVKVWEAFLLYNRHNLYNILSTYSIDNGPDQRKDYDLNAISFRFTLWDWDNTLKKLLDKHNIPVISETIRTGEGILQH